MTTRLPSLHGRLNTFACGPWFPTDDGNTFDMMVQAIDDGVDGLDITVQVSADGVAVVAGSEWVRRGLRRRRISSLGVADLQPETASLTAVIEHTLGRIPLLINLDGDAGLESVLTTARSLGREIEERLWLTSPNQSDLVRWRSRTGARLLHTTGRRQLGDGLEKLLATLHGDDIDGLSMPHAGWSGGSIALAHRFGLLAHASGARHDRELAAVIDAGIDAVSAPDAIRTAAMAAEYYR